MPTTPTVTLNEIPVDPRDPTKAAWGPDLATQTFFVLANGTVAAEQFDPADISAATRALMAQYGRGISVVLGGGGDSATGSDWGDAFRAGAGVNRIDGGANLGTAPDGSQARDVLNVLVASSEAAAALRVTALDANAGGADGEAYAAGYRVKVGNGDEIDYLRNVEQVNVFRSDQGNAFYRTFQLAPEVRTISPQGDLAAAPHFAWVLGTNWFDTFDAATDIPAATRALMAQYGRGVYIDMGAGSDKVVGSAYGDAIVAGSGAEQVDGGAGHDVLYVRVATREQAAAVRVDLLAPGADGADGAALAAGYTHKVVAGDDADYVRNIERVAVQLLADADNGTVLREIPLALSIREAGAGENGFAHLAWIDGAAGADTIRANDLVSSALAARMQETGKGVWIDGGAGDDVIVGSGQADTIRNGAGNARIDGGANAGGKDVFEIAVASREAMDAVRVSASDDPDYAWMVTYGAGSQKDYLRNIETVLVTAGAAGRWIALDDVPAPNSAPTFAGAPAGVAIDRTGVDHFLVGGAVLDDGKLLSLRGIQFEDGRYEVALVRNNADGSLDTTFGGAGRVALPTRTIANTNPVQQPDGKILVALATPGANVDLQVLRLNPDGSLDTGFGERGSVVVAVGPHGDLPTDILLMPDGRIVVSVTNQANDSTGFGAVRLLADGSLDTSFNGDGTLQFSPRPGQAASVTYATLQDDGKLLMVGLAQGSGTGLDFAIARVGVDGRLDTGFGSGGTVVLPIGPGTDNARAVVALDDGKVLVAGTTRSANNDVDSALVRLNADGSLDASFGTGGIAVARLTAGHDLFAQMALQDDGKIVVFGSMNGGLTSSAGAELMVARYHADGRLDTAFGDGGIVHIPAQGIGTGIDPGALAIVDGQIIVFGNTLDDLASGNVSTVLARIDADGRLDPGFNPHPVPSVGGSLVTDGVRPVLLDLDAAIYDADMVARGHYGGASLTLARQGGAAGSDRFSALGEVSFAGGVLAVDGIAIGRVTQSGGALTLVFDDAATQGLVNRAMHGIAYANASATPPASVPIAWTFSDGAAQTVAVTQVQIGAVVREVLRNPADPTRALDGTPLASLDYLVQVDGSARGEAFDSTQALSAANQALIAELGRGGRFDLGGGDDTLVGTAGADLVNGGTGVNRIDGGAGTDTLEIVVRSQAAADAVTLSALVPAAGRATAADEDQAAYAAGYRFKAGNGDAGTNYLKDVEQVKVVLWNDRDGDGVRDAGELTDVRTLAVNDEPAPANTAPTFAGVAAGVMVDNVGADYWQAAGSVLASGKLLSVRGLAHDDGSVEVVLARHEADGSVDTGFGDGNGRVVLDTGGIHLNPAPLELPDGKIMLAVSTPGANFDFRIMRLNADGSVDTGYGDGGSVVVDVDPGSDLPTEMLLQPDGKLIVAGPRNVSAGGGFIVAIRLDADGALDTGFGNGGKLAYSPPGVAASLSHVALQPDGKLLAVGYIGGAGALDMGVVRFNADGSFDTGFADGGVLVHTLGAGTDNARAVHVLADGKILLAGTMRSPANDVDGFLMRLNADGTPDTAFGAGGVVKAHLTDGHDVFSHMVVQPDGKIVTLGTIGATSASSGIGAELMLVRYHADGRLDTGFGDGGIATIPGHGIGVGNDPGGLALVDGQFVVFGTTTTNLDNAATQPLLARVNADGTLDADFNPAPTSSIGGVTRFSGADAVALDANAAVHDAELHARGDYGGASLTLVRQEGAAAEDVFSALGEVSFADGQLRVGGVTIGSASQDEGVLRLDFNAQATQGLVNRAMHGIGYQYDGATVATSIYIDWIFDDGEGGADPARATTEVIVDAGADPSGVAAIELVGLPQD